MKFNRFMMEPKGYKRDHTNIDFADPNMYLRETNNSKKLIVTKLEGYDLITPLEFNIEFSSNDYLITNQEYNLVISEKEKSRIKDRIKEELEFLKKEFIDEDISNLSKEALLLRLKLITLLNMPK